MKHPQEKFGLTTFRTDNFSDGLGSAFPPVVHHPCSLKTEEASLTTHLLVRAFSSFKLTMFISSSINLTIPSTTQFPNRISANSFPASSRSPVLLISKKGLPCHNSSAPGYHYPRTCCQVTVNGMTGLYYCVVKHLSVRLRVAPVCICDARPLTGSRLCPGPFGWANAATDSVSGRVWAEMTSCSTHIALLSALPFMQMRCYAPSKAPLFRVRQDVVPSNLQSLSRLFYRLLV